MIRSLTIVILSVLLFSATIVRSDEEMPLSVEDQIPILLKILSYDKNVDRFGEELTIGVVYQKRFRRSNLVKDEVIRVVNDYPVFSSAPIRIVALSLEDRNYLQQQVAINDVDALYIAPLRSFDPALISRISQELDILTTTGVPAYLDDGISVAVKVARDKPKIVINMPSATAEGSEFHSQLLKLAEVLR